MGNVKPDAFDLLVGEWTGELGQLHHQVKQLPDAIAGALQPTRKLLVEAQVKLEKQLEAMPGAADKELKRASDATFKALATSLMETVRRQSGYAAEETASKAKTEAARWMAGALIAGFVVGCGATYLAATGANSANLSTAQDKITAAESRAAVAESGSAVATSAAVAAATKNVNAELAAVKERAGWAITKEGLAIGKCEINGWRIGEENGRKYCVVQEMEKRMIGENKPAVFFWMSQRTEK